MTDYTISIPDSVYQKAQRVAREKSLSVDEVIRVGLEGALDQPPFDLPDDEKEELKAMAYLSDDTLWTIAREQMPRAMQEHHSVLMTKNNFGTISDDEYAELTGYVERGHRLMLRKAKAMEYLVNRGYTVTLSVLK